MGKRQPNETAVTAAYRGCYGHQPVLVSGEHADEMLAHLPPCPTSHPLHLHRHVWTGHRPYGELVRSYLRQHKEEEERKQPQEQQQQQQQQQEQQEGGGGGSSAKLGPRLEGGLPLDPEACESRVLVLVGMPCCPCQQGRFCWLDVPGAVSQRSTLGCLATCPCLLAPTRPSRLRFARKWCCVIVAAPKRSAQPRLQMTRARMMLSPRSCRCELL